MKVLIKDNMDGSYSAVYIGNYPGIYTASVQADGVHINGSPFKLKVIQGEASTATSYINVQERSHQHYGTLESMEIVALDSSSNPLILGGTQFVASLVGPVQLDGYITDNDDGTYMVSYFPTRSGEYVLNVQLNGHHIKNSPFRFQANSRALQSKKRKISNEDNSQQLERRASEMNIQRTLNEGGSPTKDEEKASLSQNDKTDQICTKQEKDEVEEKAVPLREQQRLMEENNNAVDSTTLSMDIDKMVNFFSKNTSDQKMKTEQDEDTEEDMGPTIPFNFEDFTEKKNLNDTDQSITEKDEDTEEDMGPTMPYNFETDPKRTKDIPKDEDMEDDFLPTLPYNFEESPDKRLKGAKEDLPYVGFSSQKEDSTQKDCMDEDEDIMYKIE